MINIVSLIDNIGRDGSMLKCEHGLSLFIECSGRRYLLDTGASGLFIENARSLGIDLANLDGVIISHNHYDHIGGLEALLEINQDVKIYIKRSAEGLFFSQREHYSRYIGGAIELLKHDRDRFVFIDDSYELDDHITLLSNSVDDDHFRARDSRLQILQRGRLEPDRFDHELFLVIREASKGVIISSCSHNGIVNIVRTAQVRYPDMEIDNIIGGFHLKSIASEMSPSDAERHIAEIAEILSYSCSKEVYTCHCTGLDSFALLKKAMGSRVKYLSIGTTLTLYK